MATGGIKSWLPSKNVSIFLGVWAVCALLFATVGVNLWADSNRVETCTAHPEPRGVAESGWVSDPDPDARLAPKLSPARGTAEESVSWPAAAGAPNGVFSAGSSSLLPAEGGRAIPSAAVEAWLTLDTGTALLTVCVDSAKTAGLDHGTFAGFAFVPTSDPARTLTVRTEVAVQSRYAGSFWPLGIVMVGLAVALAGDKLHAATKPVKWFALISGFGAFASAYYANALANPSWGGLRAVGGLLVTTFTATVGATSAASATAGRAPSSAELTTPPPGGP